MTLTSPCVFAQLPNELLHDIFKHAAADTTSALALARVATWVRHLVEPALYHTVVLSTPRGVSSFLAALAHKPHDFARTHVKHLGVFAQGPVDAIDRVLSACRSVDSLACGFSLPSYKEMHGTASLQALERPKEQHLLGLSCRDGWDVGLVGQGVTHLRVHLGAQQRMAPPVPGQDAALDSNWDELSYLPSLTHLAVVYRPTKAQPVTALLAPLQTLLSPSDDSGAARPNKLSLVLVQVVGTRTAQSAAVDALNKAVIQEGGSAMRIVAECAPSSAVYQWEQAVRGGNGVWDHAEEVMHRRLSQHASRTPIPPIHTSDYPHPRVRHTL